jgi:hypothetical protein
LSAKSPKNSPSRPPQQVDQRLDAHLAAEPVGCRRLKYLVAPFPLYRVWKGKKMLEGMTSNADSTYDPALTGPGEQALEVATI